MKACPAPGAEAAKQPRKFRVSSADHDRRIAAFIENKSATAAMPSPAREEHALLRMKDRG